MIKHIKKIGLIGLLVILVTAVVSICFKPFSILNYIGPMAAITTAFVLLWGSRAIIIVVPVVSAFLIITSYIFDFSAPISFAFIALLSIILQSVWTAQITSGELELNRWLSKRSDLISFLIKIGPVGSLVSAAAVLILSVMDNQTYGAGLIFVFMGHWSLSMLFSVFVVTLVLFADSKVLINRSKKLQVILASTLGLIALCLLFKVTLNEYQHQRIDTFNLSEEAISGQIKKRIERVDEQLHALGALFSASTNIKAEEFETFNQLIIRETTQVKFFAWLPVIKGESALLFEQQLNDDPSIGDYKVRSFSFDESMTGNMSLNAPIKYIYPFAQMQQYLGLDFLSHPEYSDAMLEAKKQGRSVATLPLSSTIQGLEGNNIYVFYPLLEHTVNIQNDVEKDTALYAKGYLVAVVDAFELFNPKSISVEHSKKVSLFIQDLSTGQPFVLYGNELNDKHRMVHADDINAFNRQWRVVIGETEPSVLQPRSWVNWGVLLGGTFGGLLYQFLILLMTAYSSELKQQIRLKTQELLLEKENADQVSQTKSKFLKMLSNELKAPIRGIAGYSDKLTRGGSEEEQQETIINIRNISEQLNQFVDTIKDMSELETGLLSVKKSSFDLHEFIQRVENVSNVSEQQLVKQVSFIIHKDVPQFIDGDELRIQQVLNALIQNGSLIFNCDTLRISVKAHMHKHSSVTIFLVVSPSGEEESNSQVTPEAIDEEFTQLNTSMTLAQEICHQLGGTIKLSPVSGVNSIISASFKADITQKDEQYFDSESLDKYQQV